MALQYSRNNATYPSTCAYTSRDAWSRLRGMTKQNAALEYVKFVHLLCPHWIESFAEEHEVLDNCDGEEHVSGSASSFGMVMPLSTLAGSVRYRR